MPLLSSTETRRVLYPAAATVALTALLLRSRDFANTGSPGSGVTIAMSEVASSLPEVAHLAVTIGERGLSLLFSVALAPLQLAYATLTSESHLAVRAIAELSSVLQSASVYLVHTF
jgi:hypothetical protein